MSFLWLIALGVVIWLVDAYFRKKATHTPVAESKITEERVFEVQNAFEKNLEYIDLPDAIDGRELYIYRNLMTKWFNKLSGEKRYDDTMTQRLREDWLDYMRSLGDRSTYNFLSLEAEDEKKQESYREDHIIASRKVFAIEDAFAAAVGKEATDELARIRARNLFAFNRHGEMAPEGQTYDGRGKLRADKQVA